MRLASARPQAAGELKRVKGMSPYLVRRYGRSVLQAIARGHRAKPPRPPRDSGHHRPDARVIARYEALRAWRKERAAQRSVDPDVILSKLKDIGLWDIDPLNLFRITWHNEPVPHGGGFGRVNYIEFPKSLTGVDARIVALDKEILQLRRREGELEAKVQAGETRVKELRSAVARGEGLVPDADPAKADGE